MAAPVITIDKCQKWSRVSCSVDTEATICLNLIWTNDVWVCDRVTFYSMNFCNRIWIIEGERKWSVSTWNPTQNTHDVHTDVAVNLQSFLHLALSVFCDVTPYCFVCFSMWLFCFKLICSLVVPSSSWPPLFSQLSALHASSLLRAAFSPPPPPSWHERIKLNRKWLRAIESIPNRKSVYSVRKEMLSQVDKFLPIKKLSVHFPDEVTLPPESYSMCRSWLRHRKKTQPPQRRDDKLSEWRQSGRALYRKRLCTSDQNTSKTSPLDRPKRNLFLR